MDSLKANDQTNAAEPELSALYDSMHSPLFSKPGAIFFGQNPLNSPK